MARGIQTINHGAICAFKKGVFDIPAMVECRETMTYIPLSTKSLRTGLIQ